MLRCDQYPYEIILNRLHCDNSYLVVNGYHHIPNPDRYT